MDEPKKRGRPRRETEQEGQTTTQMAITRAGWPPAGSEVEDAVVLTGGWAEEEARRQRLIWEAQRADVIFGIVARQAVRMTREVKLAKEEMGGSEPDPIEAEAMERVRETGLAILDDLRRKMLEGFR